MSLSPRLMPLTLKLAGSAVAALGAIVIAAVEALPQPQSLWPNTVAGWVGLFLSFSSALGVLYTLHRFSLAPLQKDVAVAKESMAKGAAEAIKGCEAQLNGFRERVEHDLNGFGKRVEALEREAGSQDSVVNGLLQAMAETRQDRKHLGESLQRIESGLNEMRDQQSKSQGEIIRLLIEQNRGHRS